MGDGQSQTSAAAAAAVVLHRVAAAAAGAVATEQKQNDDGDDDPAAVAAAPGIITHSATSYEMWTFCQVSFHSMPARRIGASASGNAIAERQQRVNKVDIFKENAGDLGGQLHIGEVPETADAHINQLVSQRLRHILRHGQHRHIGVILLHIGGQLIDGADGDVVDRGADQLGRAIKGGIDLETDLAEIEVLQQGVTQMTCAHHNDAVTVVDAQNMPDLCAQLGHVVAVALLTKLTKAAQILPDLGGGDGHTKTQRIGGDALYTLVVEVIQIAIVAGEAVDHRIGNFLSFHNIASSFS